VLQLASGSLVATCQLLPAAAKQNKSMVMVMRTWLSILGVIDCWQRIFYVSTFGSLELDLLKLDQLAS
jgi:hypothetical protein